MTFAQDILRAAGDEEIIAILLAAHRGHWWGGKSPDHSLGGEPVTWAMAFPVLNYEYDDGYGTQDCHDFWAWTETRVFFVHEYDGSTSIAWAPRNPIVFSEATQ